MQNKDLVNSKTCSVSPKGYSSFCIKLMKEDGARITRTRRAVIDSLSKTTQPLSPQDISKLISENLDESIDLASIYRILKYMSELGLVHQVGPNGGFFPCAHSHCGSGVHLITRCHVCENTTEIHLPEEKTKPLINYIENEVDFIPQEHILEIKGTCLNCADKS